jgi:hypothetical protein
VVFEVWTDVPPVADGWGASSAGVFTSTSGRLELTNLWGDDNGGPPLVLDAPHASWSVRCQPGEPVRVGDDGEEWEQRYLARIWRAG